MVPAPATRPAAAAAYGDVDIDLPVVSADLPTPRVQVPGPRQGAPGQVPPGAKAPSVELDLPAISADLPALRADLPAVRADLPAAKGGARAANAPAAAPPPAPPARRVSDLDFDLPTAAADLPSPIRPGSGQAGDQPSMAAPRSGAPAKPLSFDLDLPSLAEQDLPVAREADLLDMRERGSDLPTVSAALPVVTAGLPVVTAGLPMPAASLPQVSASLPSPAASLPAPAAGLPAPGQVLPVAKAAAECAPAASARRGSSKVEAFGDIDLGPSTDPEPAAPVGDFGEIDLPRDLGPPPMQPLTAPQRAGGAAFPPSEPPPHQDSGFGELNLGPAMAPLSVPPPPSAPDSASATPPRRGQDQGTGAGLGFGEVDLGMGDEPALGSPEPDRNLGAVPKPAAAIAGLAPPPASHDGAPRSVGMELTSVPIAPTVPRERPAIRPKGKRSLAKAISVGLAVLALLGGAALELTPYGAFGYLTIGDKLNASSYERATKQAIADFDKASAADTYEATRAAADAVAASHKKWPRARQLTAYAAMVDAALTVRFGPDASRGPRAKQLLAEVPVGEPVKYLDAATAAQAGANEEWDRARKALDAAQARDTGDPIQLGEALLRGDVEVSAHEGAKALAAYQKALAISNAAHAHFGMARAYALLGDPTNEAKELSATLAASPGHPGALTMRARLAAGTAGAAQAEKDLAPLVAVPLSQKLAPGELSSAYAAKAWLLAGRGLTGDARDAFAQAVKLDPRNVDALNGEGRLLLGESRYTEALVRFDKALQYDGSSPETIANDAEAKLDVERPADAKQQLVEAKARFPRSVPVLLLLGRVEQRLGDSDAAEADYRAACVAVDPARSDAVQPFVALSELYDARGKLTEATETLHDAKAKLPPSAALERAFGEVVEAQGDYDGALAHYRQALAMDPNDAASHFRLAGLLRRMKKFDEAGAELEKVQAIDKDYPGLSLERGLLYEQAGDVAKAMEQFKAALAKAPEDPDLQLRVGEAYVAIGRPDDAVAMLKKVIEKRAGSAEAHHFLGRAMLLKTDTASQVDAIRYLKRAVELDPNRAEFHVYLAWAANDMLPPDLELASNEVDKALAIDKQDAEAYWQRGIVERVEGQIDDAIKDEKHALDLRPSRYEAHAVLAECYQTKNEEKAALSEWPKAVAGDGKSVLATDGMVPHPEWLYRYGKLLAIHGDNTGALAQLVPAAVAVEKLDNHPGWLPDLEFQTAEALRKAGRRNDAADHYKRFLEIAPLNSPDRADAKAALAKLAH